MTMDGVTHDVGKWDLLIAHPPCTHLAVSGARWFTEGKKPLSLRFEAAAFFMKFAETDIQRIAIENPVCVMSTLYRKPDQIINPWQFGHPEQKKTCLWLKNLPGLIESDPFAELEGWESMEQIQDAYGYGEITADRRDKLTDLWEAREAAKNSRKGSDKYTDLVTEMLETAIRRVGGEYADMLFEYDRQRREAEKQCEQLAMEGMMKK